MKLPSTPPPTTQNPVQQAPFYFLVGNSVPVGLDGLTYSTAGLSSPFSTIPTTSFDAIKTYSRRERTILPKTSFIIQGIGGSPSGFSSETFMLPLASSTVTDGDGNSYLSSNDKYTLPVVCSTSSITDITQTNNGNSLLHVNEGPTMPIVCSTSTIKDMDRNHHISSNDNYTLPIVCSTSSINVGNGSSGSSINGSSTLPIVFPTSPIKEEIIEEDMPKVCEIIDIEDENGLDVQTTEESPTKSEKLTPTKGMDGTSHLSSKKPSKFPIVYSTSTLTVSSTSTAKGVPVKDENSPSSSNEKHTSPIDHSSTPKASKKASEITPKVRSSKRISTKGQTVPTVDVSERTTPSPQVRRQKAVKRKSLDDELDTGNKKIQGTQDVADELKIMNQHLSSIATSNLEIVKYMMSLDKKQDRVMTLLSAALNTDDL